MAPAVASRWAIAFLLALAWAAPATAFPSLRNLTTRDDIIKLNAKLGGQVLDFTHNHGEDRRIWSSALCTTRDLYVYLPPGYDGITAYPAMIWMHGFGQDEKSFLHFIALLDEGIRSGCFPPIIIAAPDGTISGSPSLRNNGSFYMNSKAGCFEDYIVNDIWTFVLSNFRVRPERGAHVLAGASMGGYGAYALGFKHRETFGVLAGLLPPLDIRYADCHDYYFSPYDPNCVMERDHLRRHRVIGSFFGGLMLIRERRLTDPLLGRHPPDGLMSLAAVNPVEMLVSLNIQPGEFALFVGYAGKDEFNLNAQAEHFLDVAHRRGINPAVVYVPDGLHRTSTGKLMVPIFSQWLCKNLQPYVPSGACTNCSMAAEILTGKPRKLVLTPFGQFGEANPYPLLPQLPQLPPR